MKIHIAQISKTKAAQLEKSIMEEQARKASLARQRQERQAEQARRDAAARARDQRAQQGRDEARAAAARAREQQRERDQEAARQAAELARRQREKHEAARRAELVRAVERKRVADEAEEAERRRRAAEAERARVGAEGRRRQALFEKMESKVGREQQESGAVPNENNTDAQSNLKLEEEGTTAAEAPRRSQHLVSPQAPPVLLKVDASLPPRPKCHTPPPGPPRKTRLHAQWWPRITGQFTCERCRHRIRRFAFRCPCCSTVACAKCRDVLRNSS